MSLKAPYIRSVRSDGDRPSHGVLVHCATGAAIYMDVEVQLDSDIRFIRFLVPSIDLELGRHPIDLALANAVESDPFTCVNLIGFRLRTRPLAKLSWGEVRSYRDLTTEIVEFAQDGNERFIEC